MPRKKENPGTFVTVAVCDTRHEAILNDLNTVSAQLKALQITLVGEDLRGGIVRDIQEIRSKLKGTFSGRDKAVVVTAILEGLIAIFIAVMK